MAKPSSRRMHARALLAIALSYLLGLNAFVLAATPMEPTGPFGVICSQGGSTSDHHDKSNHHPCCTVGVCCTGSILMGPPAQAPALASRISVEATRHTAIATAAHPHETRRAFEARGPPHPV